MARLCSSLLLLLVAWSSSAVTMDWTFVGDPGNACDPQEGCYGFPSCCFGSVAYGYYIASYEVTNTQYAEFLNAKAASDPLGLYNTNMGSGNGGITRSGSPGSYTYSVGGTRVNKPVNYVSFYDALRFANWMNNGQGSGDTETGAYTLLGGTPTPSNANQIARNAEAIIFLTSEDEWYKAAYYDTASATYFDYPARSDTPTSCSWPTATPNRANCDGALGDLAIKGSYTGSASPCGTFDQGGNVQEWNEAIDLNHLTRGDRGGNRTGSPIYLAASTRTFDAPPSEEYYVGFRVAMVPEPTRNVLLTAGIGGLFGLAGWRRGRA
jgi:sulfatase modifying factor 1